MNEWLKQWDEMYSACICSNMSGNVQCSFVSVHCDISVLFFIRPHAYRAFLCCFLLVFVHFKLKGINTFSFAIFPVLHSKSNVFFFHYLFLGSYYHVLP
jgi:hypothetical protein